MIVTQIAKVWFQSTHSRGVRPNAGLRSSPFFCFNPRTHEECDFLYIQHKWVIFSSFNPRTHEECDRDRQRRDRQADVSIHALTRSATVGMILYIYWIVCFNPRTHEECDRTQHVRHSDRECFNPRTHEECDYFF